MRDKAQHRNPRGNNPVEVIRIVFRERFQCKKIGPRRRFGNTIPSILNSAMHIWLNPLALFCRGIIDEIVPCRFPHQPERDVFAEEFLFAALM